MSERREREIERIERERDREREEIYPLTYNNVEKNNSSVRSVRTVRTDAERKSTSFYIQPNIAKGFKTYAQLKGPSVATVIEDAFLEYMKNHPITQTSITIVKGLDNILPEYRKMLDIKLMKKDLQNAIDFLQRMRMRKAPAEKDAWRRLERLMRRAVKNKIPDRELDELLRQAEELL